jgi:hypothetical protein
MATTSNTRRAIAAVAAAACLAALAFLLLSGSSDRSDEAEKRARDRGVTETVKTQTRGTDAQAAGARPSKLPPLFKAKGKCWGQLNEVRDFMDDNPNGASLTAAASSKLSKHLGDLYGKKSACTQTEAEGFVNQEVQPWLTWSKDAK